MTKCQKVPKCTSFWPILAKFEDFSKIQKDGHHPWNIPKHYTKYQFDSVLGELGGYGQTGHALALR